MRDAAELQVQAAQGRLGDKAGRNAARLAAYEAALRASSPNPNPNPTLTLTLILTLTLTLSP